METTAEQVVLFEWKIPKTKTKDGVNIYICPYCGSEDTFKWREDMITSNHNGKEVDCRACGKDFTTDGSPRWKARTTRQLLEDGYSPSYNENKCQQCGNIMYRRVKSYPPYCDSTYEEFECPGCGKGYAMSI